ncbi:hypothetical protein BJX99DRAFT_180091 [Aspergillus californicus]
MSSPPREKGRTSRPRGSEEEFVLFLQGIPARCRWQELKDLVRQTALHIRQAVVYDDPHGFPTGLGQIIVKNEDEAWRTYHRLSTNGWEGQSLVVMLARTSSPTQPVAGPTKGPSCVIPPSYVAGFSTPSRHPQNMAVPPSPISTESVISTSPTYHSTDYGPMLSPMVIPHQTFLPIYTDPMCPIPALPTSPTLQPSYCDPMGLVTIPTIPYAMSHHMHQPTMATSIRSDPLTTSTPRKTLYNYTNPTPSHPAYPRQNSRRTILIQNLNPIATPQDIHCLLQNTSVEHCEILPANTGSSSNFGTQFNRYKAAARVTIRSAEEAKRAVMQYNNYWFMEFKIRVKFDRSTPHTGTALHSPRTADASSRSIAGHGPGRSGLSFDLGLGLPDSSYDYGVLSAPTQCTPPETESSCSDSDEQAQSHRDSQCNLIETRSSPSLITNKPAPSPVDRCQPLVVNGSGIGIRTAVVI